ncbi:MAG: pyridoxal 5'-phosphate synthase glutaminase subunit PdxT [Terriglobales bacterium]
MLVGVLALQGDFEAHARALQAAGSEVRLVRSAGDFENLHGLVLPGGESTTMLRCLQHDSLRQRLLDSVRTRPTLATCAGAILLARRVTEPEQESLGVLDCTVVRNAYGRQLESSIQTARVRSAFRRDLGAEELEAVLIRAPKFREIGPGVEVVAEMEGEPVLLRQGALLAASFHPELSAGSPIHRWFLDRFVTMPQH